METITNTLRDSKAARWTALLIVAFTMFAGYYLTDVMSPLERMLDKELHWSATSYGWFSGSYSGLMYFSSFLFLEG